MPVATRTSRKAKTQRPNKSNHKKQKSSNKTKKYKRQYFLPHARLNVGQRKYCHCLMKARISAQNPYAACQSMRTRLASQAKTKKARRQLTFNPYSTNCVMSYDFNDYSLEEVQALAKEKGIPIHYKLKSATTKATYKPYSKDKLVEKLTQYYLSGANKASKLRSRMRQNKKTSKSDKINVK